MSADRLQSSRDMIEGQSRGFDPCKGIGDIQNVLDLEFSVSHSLHHLFRRHTYLATVHLKLDKALYVIIADGGRIPGLCEIVQAVEHDTSARLQCQRMVLQLQRNPIQDGAV